MIAIGCKFVFYRGNSGLLMLLSIGEDNVHGDERWKPQF